MFHKFNVSLVRFFFSLIFPKPTFRKLDLRTFKQRGTQMQTPTTSSFQFSIDGLLSQTRSSCSVPTHSAAAVTFAPSTHSHFTPTTDPV